MPRMYFTFPVSIYINVMITIVKSPGEVIYGEIKP